MSRCPPQLRRDRYLYLVNAMGFIADHGVLPIWASYDKMLTNTAMRPHERVQFIKSLFRRLRALEIALREHHEGVAPKAKTPAYNQSSASRVT